jgi:hypothetical protein
MGCKVVRKNKEALSKEDIVGFLNKKEDILAKDICHVLGRRRI